MSIISDALSREKEQPATGQESPSEDSPVKGRRASSGDVIGRRREPGRATRSATKERSSRSRGSDPAMPSSAKSIFVLGGTLGVVAVAIGFFIGGSSARKSADPEAGNRLAFATEATEPSGEGDSSPAVQMSTKGSGDAGIQVPVAEDKATPEPEPQATPVVVRVEVSVQSDSKEQSQSSEQLNFDRLPPLGRDPPERIRPQRVEYDIPPVPEPEATPIPAPPALTPARVRQMYQLEGIFYSEDDPMAVINGEIVGVGFEFDDMKVTKITRSTVLIELEGKEYELR